MLPGAPTKMDFKTAIQATSEKDRTVVQDVVPLPSVHIKLGDYTLTNDYNDNNVTVSLYCNAYKINLLHI